MIRIAPNHISLATKDAIPVVFGQGNKALAKSQFYDAFIGGSASVFSTRDRGEHARKRKGYSKTFAPQSVKDYTPLIQDCLKELIQQFDNACELGSIAGLGELSKIDMLKWLNYFAFDVLSDLAFGHRLGMLRKVFRTLSKSQALDAKFCTFRAQTSFAYRDQTLYPKMDVFLLSIMYVAISILQIILILCTEARASSRRRRFISKLKMVF